MKRAIILHGMPDKKEYYDPEGDAPSNRHWIPWLQGKLSQKDILTQTPEMPKPYYPIYQDWKKVFEQFDIDENTLLVGHSCGAGFLIRYLSENNIKVGKLVLVAPWVNPTDYLDNDFFEFKYDSQLTLRTKGIHLIESTDDDEEVVKSIEMIKEKIKDLDITTFSDKGHFTFNDLGTREFPELLDII